MHDIDQYFGSKKKVVRVYAERASIALKELGIEDIFATLKFEDGSIGCMHITGHCPRSFQLILMPRWRLLVLRTVAVDCADQGLSICGKDGYRGRMLCIGRMSGWVQAPFGKKFVICRWHFERDD